MTKNYVASFNFTFQTSPDTWEPELQTLICTEETTIKDIYNWAKSYCRNMAESDYNMPEIKLTEGKETKQ